MFLHSSSVESPERKTAGWRQTQGVQSISALGYQRPGEFHNEDDTLGGASLLPGREGHRGDLWQPLSTSSFCCGLHHQGRAPGDSGVSTASLPGLPLPALPPLPSCRLSCPFPLSSAAGSPESNYFSPGSAIHSSGPKARSGGRGATGARRAPPLPAHSARPTSRRGSLGPCNRAQPRDYLSFRARLGPARREARGAASRRVPPPSRGAAGE